MIQLAAAAAIALLVSPSTVTPNPQILRAALLEPTDASFVEADLGTSGMLEGPFDLQSYMDFYRSSGTDEGTVRDIAQNLRHDGFAGGYGREWYRPGKRDVLGEMVMVFTTSSGALSFDHTSKVHYAGNSGFGSFVNPHLDQDAFAFTYSGDGYSSTLVVFAKGNAMFLVGRSSDAGFNTDATVTHADRIYAAAPSGFPLQAPSSQPALGQYLRLLGIAGLVALLMLATVVAVVVYVLRAPRPVDPAQVPESRP